MEGKGVIVAGGAGGLGRAVAQLMLDRGAHVLILDRAAEGLAAVCTWLGDQGLTAQVMLGDIVEKDETQKLFDQAVERMGRIHSVVNCVGVYPRVPLLEISDADWRLSLTVNVAGTYNLAAAAVRHMKQQDLDGSGVRGRIVNISSVDAFKAHPQNAHYAATKAAVVSLTRSFAHEFAADQILVNSVAPAGIATERAKAAGFMPELVAHNPLGRAAEPDDIAEWVVFMASSRNRYATGENAIVSGGYVYA